MSLRFPKERLVYSGGSFPLFCPMLTRVLKIIAYSSIKGVLVQDFNPSHSLSYWLYGQLNLSADTPLWAYRQLGGPWPYNQ